MKKKMKNRFDRKKIFTLAWQMVKRNGFTLSEALKTAWLNAKLTLKMSTKIVQFYFTKRDGSIRQAFGTLKESIMGKVKGTGRMPNENVQVYWDCEREAFRSFVKCNLIKIV